MKRDEIIKNNIIAQLRWDSRIDSSDIKVTVDDGAVQLDGVVPSYTSKSSALVDAYNVPGVEYVKNDIKVAIPLEGKPDDEEIERNLANKYYWDSDLNTIKIKTDVNNGWVTLEGTVDAYWKIIAAEDIAKNTQGVTGVTNLLAVTPRKDINDELIAEDVMSAIARDARVDAKNVNVEVKNAEVILNGIVKDYTAKGAAFNCAVHTLGVEKITDNLIVNPN